MSSKYQFCPIDGLPLVQTPKMHEGRKYCTSCGFVNYQNPFPCVAILITEGNNVLLARRGIEPHKGMWDIPGGFIEVAESAEDTVVREALEETGLEVEVEQFLGSVSDVYGDNTSYTLNFCFTAKVVGGEMKAQSDVESLQWFNFKSLPNEMAFAHQLQVLDLVRKRIK